MTEICQHCGQVIPTDSRMSFILRVRVTPQEAEALRAAATQNGQTLSQYIRDRLTG